MDVDSNPKTDDKAVNVGDVIEVTTVNTGKVERITDMGIYYRDSYGESREVNNAEMSSIKVVEQADNPTHDLIGTIAELDGKVYVKYLSGKWIGMGDVTATQDKNMAGRVVTGVIQNTSAANAKRYGEIFGDWNYHHVKPAQLSDRKQCAWYYDTEQCCEWNVKDSDFCYPHTEDRIRVLGSEDARRASYYETKVTPLTVNYGDSEPDHRKKFLDHNGNTVSARIGYGPGLSCWLATDLNEMHAWVDFFSDRFPMTELQVVEPTEEEKIGG